MGELLRFPDGPESQPDGLWQRRLATASGTVDNIIGLTGALGACLKGLLLSVRRLEEAAQGVQDAISRLPAGEAKRQLEHQRALMDEELAEVLRLLRGF